MKPKNSVPTTLKINLLLQTIFLIFIFIASLLSPAHAFADSFVSGATAQAAENLPDEECEKSRLPTKTEILNASQMATEMHLLLDKTAQEFQQQGKVFDVAFIARTGTSHGSLLPLNEAKNSDRDLSLREMLAIAQHKIDTYAPITYKNKDDSNQIDDVRRIVERLYGEYANPYYSLRYSHMGIVFREHPQKGKWFVVHLLSPCYSDKSNIYDEGMARFFVDKPYDYGALVVIPTAEIQRRVKEVIFEDHMAWKLKAPVYNIASVMENYREGNSNFWTLEILAAAMRPRGWVNDRSMAQYILKQEGYRPSKISLHGKYETAASTPDLFLPDYITVRDSEHPYAASYGLAELVTVLSIDQFLAKKGLIEKRFEYRLDDRMRFKDGPKQPTPP